MSERRAIRPEVLRHTVRVGRRTVECAIGLPPDTIEPQPTVVQLSPGLVSGHAIFEAYAPILNNAGYPTVVIRHDRPSLDSHHDVVGVTHEILSGSLPLGDSLAEAVTYATHSLGTRNAIVGVANDDGERLGAGVKHIIAYAPVGYGGVQSAGGALQTLLNEAWHRPSAAHIRSISIDAFRYSLGASFSLRDLIREAKQCQLHDETKALIGRGIGIGAVVFRDDHLVRAGPAKQGLSQAGVVAIQEIPGDHNSILFSPERAAQAGFMVRDTLNAQKRAA